MPAVRDQQEFALRKFLGGGGRRVRIVPSGTCWQADASGGFEEYLKRLTHENRRQARKMLRDVHQNALRFELAGPTQIDAFFAQMIDLHRKRWTAAGEAGAFAPRHAEFHRELARTLVPRGQAVLARLANGDRPLAVVYGYRTRNTVHCYQQGVDRTPGPLRSPGTAAWLLLMKKLAAEGVVCFDHQKGTTQFKERFCPHSQPVFEIHVSRPTLRAAASFLVDVSRRGMNKARRIATGQLVPRLRLRLKRSASGR